MASDGTIKIDTELDSTKAKSALSEFSSLGKTALNGVKIAIGAVTTAMTAMAAYSVKAGSDFEAGMSKVSAISGATGSELDALSDKAKEMGSKTKFSATEAASAFEYMAMAGWKTEDMLNGIEGVMNLAAASGEDLAVTSDIVTDALTAFGMQASDSAHFADVLAAASSNANTNVGMMGETFKYVAPVAGALGFSVEDTAVAIGLMANSGIKASQAGTALRSIFTRLVKPTDQIQAVMDKLGFSLTDAEGNTKGLDTVMKELRSSFDGLTEAEKAQYAATLAGQEGMSGFLAIVNASDADFHNLTSAIGNADGAAERMAETMNDNLKGSITIAGSALEGFGIKVYERMEAPLREAVDTGTDCINRLASAFDSGGLNGVVEEAGEIFNDLADDIAGSSEAAEGIVTPLKNIANAGAKLGKSALPVIADGLEFAAENFGVLLPLVTGATVGFKAFNVIGKITAATTKANAAAVAVLNNMEKKNALQLVAVNGGLTVRQTLLAVYNGQITLTTALTGLWTKAQTALNTAISANPIGVAVAVMATFIAVAKAMSATVAKQTEAEREHSKALRESKKAAEENLEKAKERKRSYEELVQSQNEQAAAEIIQLNNLQKLNSELQAIVDENGKVKSGEEERAAFITSQLSNALGIEISMTDNQIANYQELQEQIQNLIQQKRIDAVLTAQQAKYEEAVANQMKAAAEASANYTAMKKAEIAVEAEQAELESLTAEKRQAVIDGNMALVKTLDDKIKKQEEDVESASEALSKSKEAYQENTELLAQYANDIEKYTALAEAAATGNAEAIEAAITQITAGIKTASNATREELQKQVVDVANTENLIRQEVEKGTPGFTQAMLEQAQSGTAAALEEFANAAPLTAKELAKVPPEAVAALLAGNMRGQLSTEAQGAVEEMLAQFDGLDEETQNSFAQVWYGALEGLEGFEQLADPAKEGADTFLDSLKEALEVHSPSEAVRRIFAQVWPGASEGLSEGAEELNTKGAGVVTSFLNSLSVVGEGARSVGANIMSFFGIGISSQQGNSQNAGKANADAASRGAGSVNPSSVGTRFGGMFGTGIGGASGIVLQKGKEIADKANQGAGSVDPTGTGGKFGSQYASGVGSKTGDANAKGRALANSADSGAGSKTGYNSGSNFGAGFVNGIGAWLGKAASAAANLAMSAYNALRNALSEHSPSRKAKKSGKNFDLGFGIGIDENAAYAVSAAERLSEDALNAVDTDALKEKLRGMDVQGLMNRFYCAVDDRNMRVSEKIVASVSERERRNDPPAEVKMNLDYKRLALEISKRPLYISTKVGDRELVNVLAVPMEERMRMNNITRNMLDGRKS